MNIQVFIVVLLVALGTATRERNHDEHSKLRELFRGWKSIVLVAIDLLIFFSRFSIEFEDESLDASERKSDSYGKSSENGMLAFSRMKHSSFDYSFLFRR